MDVDLQVNNIDENISIQIQDLLKQINLASSYVFSKVLENSALTFHQVYIIKIISNNPNINLKTLCNELKLSKGAMSLTINKLVEGGYILRRENATDRRSIALVLTDKGHEVLKDTIKKGREAFEQLTQGLTDEELQNIKLSLTKLKISMNDALQKGSTIL